jgi:hypothetical protein
MAQYFKINSEKLARRFRDPVWEFWGAVIAIITLVISTFVAYDVLYKSKDNSELTIKLKGYYKI